jgi:hypothetical protein
MPYCTGDELWRIYALLTRAESAFRDMKSPLAERPIFHQLEHRVEAHIFLCVLAYHLLISIEKTLLDRGIQSAMSDAPRPPPPLPQNALIWIVVAALVLVLVRAAWARIVLKGLWIGPRCCAALASGTPNHGATALHMTHRHFGVPGSKFRRTYTGHRAAAWSGGAIIGGIIASVIVLGFILYDGHHHVSAAHWRSKPSTVE